MVQEESAQPGALRARRQEAEERLEANAPVEEGRERADHDQHLAGREAQHEQGAEAPELTRVAHARSLRVGPLPARLALP